MSDKQIFQVQAMIVDDIKVSPQGSIKFKIETQEGQTGDTISRFSTMRNKLGWFNFAVPMIQAEDLLKLPEIKTVEKGEQTPAQKLRAALFVLWQKAPEGFKTDEEHYKYYAERMRQWVLEKIPKE